ncbi:acyl-CoA synthetase (AMP-forming)/AMP-acid ligase II [Halovivax ruber XH-70]|uniref:Acyl-CoA synthetase (AMP-forming)/AMP-acid ligase II n=1 Tax=Halovivax ruber (strain DSM 18193 / JCM 13892 / XH-70) TaxID=797302 RepID=L0ICJ9_HALRX|nr:class I adenylate-forming enzyme family protein [Halovivax ruber]AGB15946.1 acyl-CoA synthetase (AMP-forming)/AMP-acid ligase II [Halovivax ruber XH-70]
MTPTSWPTTDLCAKRAATTPDRTALVDGDSGRQWTYRELDDAVDATATRFDLEPGAVVATILPTGPQIVVTIFALARLGATGVLLSPDESADELRTKTDQTSIDCFVGAAETESVAKALASSDGVDHVTIDPIGDTGPTDDQSTNADERDHADRNRRIDPAPLAPDHTQIVVFTSGTTGTPKGVRVTVENLRASAIASALRLGVDPSDRWLVPLPQHHMGGFAPIIRSALYGTAVVTTRQTGPADIARHIESHRCTGLSVVPTMVRSLLEWGWEPPAHLRFVLVGGAPTPPELVTDALEADVPIYPSYGASEAASQIATATPSQASRAPESVGNPLFETDVRIVDHEGNPVERGESGEVVVSGPTISPGYLDPDQTAGSFTDGRFRTGDLGHRDDVGRLRITGRRSDRIITGGETVDPAEVARVLRSHEGIADAAVVGIPDRKWGERVAAALVLEPGVGDFERQAVETFCENRLATHKRPRTIAVVEQLPRTDSGTVDRNQLAKRLDDE